MSLRAHVCQWADLMLTRPAPTAIAMSVIPQQQRREKELRKQQEREQRRHYEEQMRREEERRRAEHEQVPGGGEPAHTGPHEICSNRELWGVGHGRQGPIMLYYGFCFVSQATVLTYSKCQVHSLRMPMLPTQSICPLAYLELLTCQH